MPDINGRDLKKPSFIVIGAEKSGTTSLFHYLYQHPEIFMPPVKELNYYIVYPEKWSLFQGPDVTFKKACRSQNEYFKMFKDAVEVKAIGEIGHIYLYAPESPVLIRATIGAPKIIAIIRNPLERAYAQFVFHRNLGMEPASTFEEAIEDEDRRVKGGWDPVYHYVRRGFYGQQLVRYYREFPEKNIKVYKFEHFFKHPRTSMAKLYDFIGVDPEFITDITQKYIPGGNPRAPEFISTKSTDVPSPKPIKTKTRKLLVNIYSDDIRKTQELTGLDLSDWLEPG
jgi:sulfotransferase family protein